MSAPEHCLSFVCDDQIQISCDCGCWLDKKVSTLIGYLLHAYQSLACETSINTDFSELFSLKHIYVKYKNAILSLIDCFFRT